MKLNDLPIGKEFTEILKGDGIQQLYPPQIDAVKSGVLDGENLILATPTRLRELRSYSEILLF